MVHDEDEKQERDQVILSQGEQGSADEGTDEEGGGEEQGKESSRGKEREEEEENDIPRLEGAPGGKRLIGMISKFPSRVARVLHEYLVNGISTTSRHAPRAPRASVPT